MPDAKALDAAEWLRQVRLYFDVDSIKRWPATYHSQAESMLVAAIPFVEQAPAAVDVEALKRDVLEASRQWVEDDDEYELAICRVIHRHLAPKNTDV